MDRSNGTHRRRGLGRAGAISLVLVLVVVGAGIIFAPTLIPTLLNDAPVAPPEPKPKPTIIVEEDPSPSFEPGALRTLVAGKQEEGMDATVNAYIRWLAANARRIHEIKDYSMNLIKTERIDGKLWPTERADVKVRHDPFSVYMLYHEPKGLKGQEVLYVAGQNEGRIVGHTGGLLSFVILRIDPRSERAMQGNRHPVMELGLAHMVDEAVRNVPVDMKRGNSDFFFYLDEKIEGKNCTCFEIRRRKPDPEDRNPAFSGDKMWFDDENNLPIFYRRFEWAPNPKDEPVLVEEYTHGNLKLENGFTDLDFDEKNPAYSY